MWLALVLVGIGFMIYQVSGRITYFKGRPAAVRVTVVNAKALKFSCITFCNENLIRSSSLFAYGGAGALNIASMLYPAVGPFVNTTSRNIDFLGFDYTTVDWEDFYSIHGNQAQNGVKQCRWRGDVCSHENFTSVMTDMYHCFTFNPKGEYTLDRTGAKNGLQLILDVQQHEYIAVSSTSISAGYLVLLHEADEVPRMSDMAFKVSPGTHTLAPMSVTKRKSLPSPFGECQDSSSTKLERYKTYSLSACKSECQANYVENTCNCTQIHIPYRQGQNVSERRQCNPRDLNECVFDAQKEYVQDNVEAKCVCPEPCSVTTYSAQLSSSVLSEYMKNTLEKYMNITAEYSEKNYVKIDFFFREISYLMIEEKEAYTVLALFCDIGGALGLILGSTLLTVCEIIDFIFVAISAMTLQRKYKNNKPTTASGNNVIHVQTIDKS